MIEEVSARVYFGTGKAQCFLHEKVLLLFFLDYRVLHGAGFGKRIQPVSGKNQGERRC